MPAAASAYGVCFTIKSIFNFKRKYFEKIVIGLLADIDKVDITIRKNISYFRETKFLKKYNQDAVDE